MPPLPFTKDKKPSFAKDGLNKKPVPFQRGKKDSQDFAKTEFVPTQKRVFENDKKRDNDKRNRDMDRMGGKNKKLSRQGLLEEYSITERIMGSRKIKTKKAKQVETVVSALG